MTIVFQHYIESILANASTAAPFSQEFVDLTTNDVQYAICSKL